MITYMNLIINYKDITVLLYCITVLLYYITLFNKINILSVSELNMMILDMQLDMIPNVLPVMFQTMMNVVRLGCVQMASV